LEVVESVFRGVQRDGATGGLVRFASRRWQLANVLPTTVATIAKTLRRARGGLTMAGPFAGPPTRFNASVTADRNVALAQLDLDDIKKVKDRFKVTVNDVVMALCASVLRWFLSDHAELPAARWWRWCRCRCMRSPTARVTTSCRGC
jgi:hypothetical protein